MGSDAPIPSSCWGVKAGGNAPTQGSAGEKPTATVTVKIADLRFPSATK